MCPPILHPLHRPYTQTGLPSFIVGQFYWFKWQQLNTNGYGKFYGGEIVAVCQHKIQRKWLETPKLASRAIITLSKQQPERITDQLEELQYLQHDWSLHRDEIRQQIFSGIPLPHVSYPPDYLILRLGLHSHSIAFGIFSIPVNRIRPSNGWKASLTL